MIRKSDTTSGLKVKIVASVGDTNNGRVYEGWSTVDIIQPKVQIDFLGPREKIIDSDLSFSTMVRISFQLSDLKKDLLRYNNCFTLFPLDYLS